MLDFTIPATEQPNTFMGYAMREHVTANEVVLPLRWEYLNTSTFYPSAPLKVAECGKCYVIRLEGVMRQYFEVYNGYERCYTSCKSLHEAVGTMRGWTQRAAYAGKL